MIHNDRNTKSPSPHGEGEVFLLGIFGFNAVKIVDPVRLQEVDQEHNGA